MNSPRPVAVGFLPVASRVSTCQVCCRMTTLPGMAMQAMVAQVRCMVPLYTMMMSVVSVLRSSLTTILAQALKQACSTGEIFGFRVWQDEGLNWFAAERGFGFRFGFRVCDRDEAQNWLAAVRILV